MLRNNNCIQHWFDILNTYFLNLCIRWNPFRLLWIESKHQTIVNSLSSPKTSFHSISKPLKSKTPQNSTFCIFYRAFIFEFSTVNGIGEIYDSNGPPYFVTLIWRWKTYRESIFTEMSLTVDMKYCIVTAKQLPEETGVQIYISFVTSVKTEID